MADGHRREGASRDARLAALGMRLRELESERWPTTALEWRRT
jgi:hypothetical protein